MYALVRCILDKGSDLDVGAECELEGTEWQHERDLGKGGHLDASGQCEPEAAKSEHEGQLDKEVELETSGQCDGEAQLDLDEGIDYDIEDQPKKWQGNVEVEVGSIEE
ncbi:hypothetical protein DEO72_LG7g2138 [Vigna unguiculata]|uniref:Uncharacterized protein n=1 Tax=Vigna unguiculata TaxID=3917 RepID=A0A4D6MLH4_VIGUN|nr:hypothetical protein DEO72_LG7g2138 [Vigna unguiculata]